MTQTLSFRSDLAQLSDAELARRLEDNWQRYEAAQRRPFWSWSWWPFMGTRGPIRHPHAYRFFAALSGDNGNWLSLLFATAFSHKGGERLLWKSDPKLDAHLTLCEIQDIVEEAERRVAKRKEAKS
jgi:hypothetical protein